MSSNEVLLKVEKLSQHFKMQNSVLKAVDGIDLEIKKGEVFGLVGESGCGKTTTGRTIIKLYNATSGNVFLKGQRICAGTYSYTEKKKEAAKTMRKRLKELSAQKSEKLKMLVDSDGTKLKNEIQEEFKPLVAEAKNEYRLIIGEMDKEIKAAETDQNKCDKLFAKKQISILNEEYLPRLEALKSESINNEDGKKRYDKLKAEYNEKLRIAKRERLITQIQMIFQDPIASLNPRMTVREIIAEGLKIKGYRRKDVIDEKVFEMLNLVGLVPEHAERYPHEFSGGQRQRIGIARAIILNPELLIADEPVSALDVSIQAQVITLLNELRNKIDLTILFIAHDLSVVKYFSDRIAVMYYGKIMELAPTEELFAMPLHPYTRALLSAVPYPDPHYEKQRKRIIYNPLSDHDYSVEKPEMREIKEGHFIYCNMTEFEKYQTENNIK